jgi:hypothetical protein
VYATAPPPPRLKRGTLQQLAQGATAVAAAGGSGGSSAGKDLLAAGKLPAGSAVAARAHASGFGHFVYEWFLQRFGTRALAEVQLHDFFVNLQLYATGSAGLGAELAEDGGGAGGGAVGVGGVGGVVGGVGGGAAQEVSAAQAIGDAADSLGSAVSVADRCRTFACLLGARGTGTVSPGGGGADGDAANSTTGTPTERALAARADAASDFYLHCLAMINQLVAAEAAKGGGTGVNAALAEKAKKAKAGEGVGPLFPRAGEVRD